ncbi:hypothetical protein GQ472_01605 [archaeon]|nr:hypothetical protein [archaeon]
MSVKIIDILGRLGCAVASAIVTLDMFMVLITVHMTSGYSLWNLLMVILLHIGMITMYLCLYIFFIDMQRRIPDYFWFKVIADVNTQKEQETVGG